MKRYTDGNRDELVARLDLENDQFRAMQNKARKLLEAHEHWANQGQIAWLDTLEYMERIAGYGPAAEAVPEDSHVGNQSWSGFLDRAHTLLECGYHNQEVFLSECQEVDPGARGHG